MSTPSLGPFAEPIHTTGAWGAWWRGWYRLLRLVGRPLGRLAVRPGFGNLVVLRVVGRRSGRERARPSGCSRCADGATWATPAATRPGP